MVSWSRSLPARARSPASVLYGLAAGRAPAGEVQLRQARALMRAALDHCLEGRELATRTVARSLAGYPRKERSGLMHPSIALGVNIDHVATLRQQRQTRYPEPVQAALLAEQAGADNITLHLREDRRHIQERDVRLLAELLETRMNLEMAATPADGRARLRSSSRPTAAWCPSGAPS